jgi:hypothetical protein
LVAVLAIGAILIASLAGCAASHRTVTVRLQTDTRIERRAADRYREILDKLEPSARQKLKRASQSFAGRMGECPDAEDPAVLARQEVERAFDQPSEAQADLLTLGVLAGVSVDASSGRLDRLGDMGELEQLRLQMAMDRRSKFISTLSNLMKKLSDTSAAIVQNMK